MLRESDQRYVNLGRQRGRGRVPKARSSVEGQLPNAGGSPDALVDDSVHLGRQPVYDADLAVVGYELLFRRAGAVTAHVADPERATADVVVKTFADFGLDSVV